MNPDLFGLIEMCTYGLKGCCAYYDHAEKLRKAAPITVIKLLFLKIFDGIYTDEERLDLYQ